MGFSLFLPQPDIATPKMKGVRPVGKRQDPGVPRHWRQAGVLPLSSAASSRSKVLIKTAASKHEHTLLQTINAFRFV